jgi:1-deoxy-D-xylulose-5-phosphate synthase
MSANPKRSSAAPATPASAEPSVSALARVSSPADLRDLSTPELAVLASEIRDFLVAKVSRTG